jgi:DNA-binding GntR family transcriptional regulator
MRFKSEDYKKIYQMREILEGGNAYILAEEITNAHLSELKKIIDAQNKAFEDRNTILYVELDFTFHEYLISCSKNDILGKVFKKNMAQCRKFILVSSIQSDGVWNENIVNYDNNYPQQIYEALANHNSEKTEKLIKEHIRHSYENVILMIKDNLLS